MSTAVPDRLAQACYAALQRVPPNLDKPGRRYVLHEGKQYRIYGHIYEDREIERLSDGATLFLQGEDADTLDRELVKYEQYDLPACDKICSNYSELLKVE